MRVGARLGLVRSPYRGRDRGAPLMAKAEATGTVTAFLHGKFKQDSHRTVVELAKPEEATKLLGARVV